MTTPLHDRLEDLVADVPNAVRPDIASAAAAGARRRVRRRVATGALGALCVLVVALTALSVSVTPDAGPADEPGGRPTVTGYPTHVRADWQLDPLPAAPGPLAGVVQDAPQQHWMLVSANGAGWRAPGIAPAQPSLSPDGTRLVYMTRSRGMVLRDLVTGDEVTVGLADNNARTTGWRWDMDSTIRWSPDNASFAVMAERRDVRGQHLLVWADGNLQDIGRTDYVAGWAPDGSLVTLSSTSQDRQYVVAALVRGLDGRLRNEAYDPTIAEIPEAPLPNQLFVDRAGQLVVLGRDGLVKATTRTYDVTTGDLVDQHTSDTGAYAVSCQWSLAGDSPAYLSNDKDGDFNTDAAVLVTADGRQLVTMDPGSPSWCASFAADALSGKAYTDPVARVLGVVGLDDSWAYWRWRELSLGVLFIVLLPLAAGALAGRPRGRSWNSVHAVVLAGAGLSAVLRDDTLVRDPTAGLVSALVPCGVLVAALWTARRGLPWAQVCAGLAALVALADPPGGLWEWIAVLGAALAVGTLLARQVIDRRGFSA